MIFLFFALLYAFTRTSNYSYDAVTYALSLDYASGLTLFHSYHLLALLPALFVDGLFSWFNVPVRALYVMQVLNVLYGAGALAWFFAGTRKVYGAGRALAATAFCGACFSFWYESTEAGSYALANLAAVGLMMMALRARSPRPFLWGIMHGLAVGVHILFAAGAPAFLYRLWEKSDLKKVGSYLAGLALSAGGSYAVVLAFFYRGNARGAFEWVFGPPAANAQLNTFQNPHWNADLLSNTYQFFLGWAKAVAPFSDGGLKYLWIALWAALFLGAAVLTWRRLKKDREQKWLMFLWIWIAGIGFVEFFYAPGLERFRLLFLPAVVLIALELAKPMVAKPKYLAALSIAIGMLAGYNYFFSLRPHLSEASNPNITRARWVAAQIGPRDFFLFEGTEPRSIINVYMGYFARGTAARSVKGFFYSSPQSDMQPFNELFHVLRSQNGRFWIEAALLDPAVQAELEKIHNLSPGTLSRWAAAYQASGEMNDGSGYRILTLTK